MKCSLSAGKLSRWHYSDRFGIWPFCLSAVYLIWADTQVKSHWKKIMQWINYKKKGESETWVFWIQMHHTKQSFIDQKNKNKKQLYFGRKATGQSESRKGSKQKSVPKRQKRKRPKSKKGILFLQKWFKKRLSLVFLTKGKAWGWNMNRWGW